MPDSSLGALQELKDAISQESCIPKPPFIELGEGNASILNYNLPQATCYSATALVKLTIPLESFKASERTVPVDNFWDIHASRSIDAIRVDLDTRVRALPRQSLLADAFELNARSVASAQAGANVESLKVANRDDILADSVTEKPMVRFYKPEVTKDLVSVRIKQGYMPVPYIRFSGLRDFYYIPKPVTPKPQISIVLHYKVCSFLGDYGAGQTIKTFSLLPGEKVEIGIRHYQRNESTRKQTQHVLDSFSTSAAEELQDTVENEFLHTSGETNGETKESNWNVGGNLGISVGVFNLGVQGGGGGAKTKSFASTVQDQTRILDSAISKHVAKADTLRQIDVNVESSDTSITESEETIKRFIENYNKSRVLNFVFRQLMQEYISITYLDNVTFTYSNGYPEKSRTCGLAELESMLTDVLVDSTTVQAEANKIYTYLCNIIDYTGTKTSFIELIREDNANCINPTAPHVVSDYVRKRRINKVIDGVTYSVELEQTAKGKTVPGIITSVQSRIIRTSSLVVDALLGQGEALDCYNQKLQDAASINAHLTNLENVQKINTIELMASDVRPDAYKKIFGDCCPTPQNVLCNCNTPTPDA